MRLDGVGEVVPVFEGGVLLPPGFCPMAANAAHKTIHVMPNPDPRDCAKAHLELPHSINCSKLTAIRSQKIENSQMQQNG